MREHERTHENTQEQPRTHESNDTDKKVGETKVKEGEKKIGSGKRKTSSSIDQNMKSSPICRFIKTIFCSHKNVFTF